jgi:hypothetical protein
MRARLSHLWFELRMSIVRVLFPRTSLMIGWDLGTPEALATSRYDRVVVEDCMLHEAEVLTFEPPLAP